MAEVTLPGRGCIALLALLLAGASLLQAQTAGLCNLTPSIGCPAASDTSWECPAASSVRCADGVCTTATEVRIGRFPWGAPLTAKLFWPESGNFRRMGMVMVHGGACRGRTDRVEEPLARFYARNKWVVAIPSYRGDDATWTEGDCNPGHCDIGCKELADIHAAACYLKTKLNTCASLACPSGVCLDPGLVFGMGFSAGGGRLLLETAYFPRDFRRIAVFAATGDLRADYPHLEPVEQCWINKVLTGMNTPPSAELLEDRSPASHYDELVANQLNPALGNRYLTGIIAFHGLSDARAWAGGVDAFLDNVDAQQAPYARLDPSQGILTQKFLYADVGHDFMEMSCGGAGQCECGSECPPQADRERAFESVNAATRFFKDERPDQYYRARLGIKARPGKASRAATANHWLASTALINSSPNTLATVAVESWERLTALGSNCLDPITRVLEFPPEIARVPANACTSPDAPCPVHTTLSTPAQPQSRTLPGKGQANWKADWDLSAWRSGACGSPQVTAVRHEAIVRQPDPGLCLPVGDEDYDPFLSVDPERTPDGPACSIRGRYSIRTALP